LSLGRLQRPAVATGQQLDDVEAHVVAGTGVLGPGIAEPHHQQVGGGAPAGRGVTSEGHGGVGASPWRRIPVGTGTGGSALVAPGGVAVALGSLAALGGLALGSLAALGLLV